ncbi:TPA: hypothetical protein ACH3X1_003670 [Trebouxia sp. C0004]
MEQVLDKYQAVEEAAVCMAICHPSVVQTHFCVLKVPAAQQYLDRLHGLQENRQAAELAALQQGRFHSAPHKPDPQAGHKSCCRGVWPCLALPCQQQQTASAEGVLGTALVKLQGQTNDRTTHRMSPVAQDSKRVQAACHSRPCRSLLLPQCQAPCANDLQSDNKSPKVCSPQPRLDRILTVAQQIAAALEHVHSQSVVHGDVTSHNVLLANRVTRYGPCVADFGICTRLQSPGPCQGAVRGDHAGAHGTLM